MNDDRLGGLALILGSLGMVVTMAFHPTGHDLQAAADAGMQRSYYAHALANVSAALLFLGGIALTKRLASPDRIAVAALVAFGFAAVAAMSATVTTGFVAPGIMSEIAAADGSTREMWQVAMHYSGRLNQAYARIHVVASCLAILLWSISMRRTGIGRGAAILGIVSAPLAVLALVSGRVRLDVHGLGAIVLVQAIWFVATGLRLRRA